jgi:hypothetical protein
MKLFLCLLFSIAVFSQSKQIELKIDSITISNTDDARRFTLHYHITNLTKKPISFVLNPSVYYKLYENESSIDVIGIFNDEKETRSFKNKAEFDTYRDSLMNYRKNLTPEQLLQIKKENFLKNIQELASNKTIHFTKILIWDKQRYHKNDVIEYFIEEKEKHFIELHINLMAEELLLSFSEAEKNELLKDKTLTKGWFTSNKMEINLGE